MLEIKIFTLFVIFSSCFSAREQNRIFEPYFRFKSTQCSSSNKSLSGYKCFVKSYSRKNATLNVFVNLTRPVNFVNVQYDFTYRSLSNSQRSIINATFEVCSILNGTGSNPVFQWLLGLAPDLKQGLHPCPYQVLKY